MSGADAIAEILRATRADLEDTRRRMASVVMIGRVVERSGDKVRLEFDAADPSTGKPFRSPLVRRANSSGETHKERNRPAMGEIMALLSPNGEIGRHSRAIPYGPVDDSQEPQGDDDFPRVIQEGNARIAIKDGMIRITVGGTTWTFTPQGFDQTGGHHKHDGKNTGRDHVHGGVVKGGDNTEAPAN